MTETVSTDWSSGSCPWWSLNELSFALQCATDLLLQITVFSKRLILMTPQYDALGLAWPKGTGYGPLTEVHFKAITTVLSYHQQPD